MPALTYPTSDFVPFTKILSSEVNGKFTAIKTLLNTTGLSYTNLQLNNLMYTSQTSMQVVGTNATGYMTTQPLVLVTQGGTGISVSFAAQSPGDVFQINAGGTAFTVGAPSAVPASLRIYQASNFT